MHALATSTIDWSGGSPVDPRTEDAWCDGRDPLGEVRHVFLHGNDLPARWRRQDLDAAATAKGRGRMPDEAGPRRFVVGEIGLGFGRTLCMLADAFVRTAEPSMRLVVVTIERAPLSRADAARALAWAWGGGPLPTWAEELLAQWPPPVAGVHPFRLAEGRVRGVAVLGEAADVVPRLEIPGGVDAWCLDGFSPSRDGSAWTDPVLAAVGRLTAAGGTVATWSAATAIRDRLAAAGFAVQRRPGHGGKRHMLVGRMLPRHAASAGRSAGPRTAVVVGGGLAGSAVAASLADRGVRVTVLDDHRPPPGGASAIPRAIAEPVLSVGDTAASRLRWTGWRMLLMEAGRDGAAVDAAVPLPGGATCGVLHGDLPRWRAIAEALGPSHAIATWVDAAAASDIAGLRFERGGLFVPSAGWLVPRLLVARRLDAVVRAGGRVLVTSARSSDDDSPPDVMIDATARGLPGSGGELPTEAARGQVSLVTATSVTRRLRTIACGRTACLPAMAGEHLLASTFDHHDDDASIRPDDHRRILERLAEGRPALGRMLAGAPATGAWAGIRRTTPDRLPLVGELERLDGGARRFVSLAHGSRGVVGGAIAGELIAAMLFGEPLPALGDDAAAFEPGRFRALLARRRG